MTAWRTNGTACASPAVWPWCPGLRPIPSIGRSCATRLGLEGASVVINGRDPTTLAATERDLLAQGIRVVAVAGSMEDDGTPARLVEAARSSSGGSTTW